MNTKNFRKSALATSFALLASCAVGTLGASSAAATTSSSTCGVSAVVGVNTSTGALNRWIDSTPAADGGFGSAAAVGSGWSNALLTASDSATGQLFATFTDGSLRLYTFNGSAYGGGAVIGNGWANATNLMPMGDGVFYATFSDGSLKFYHYDNGSFTSDSGTAIGGGWGAYTSVASGGNGVLYGANNDGQLYWFKKSSPATAAGSFSTAKVIGSAGWASFSKLIGSGDGVIHAVKPNGDLYFYNHLAPSTGAVSWSSDSGTLEGNGWNNWKALTANPDGCTASGGVTYDSLVAMFGSRVGDRTTVEQGLASLNAEMQKGAITTAARKAAFLATLVNESRVKYNALQDANTYTGRGFIQLTGSYNYNAAGNYFGIDLLNNPDQARSISYSAPIARWYWTVSRPGTNAAADAWDMGRVSALIGYAPSSTEDAERCEDFKVAMEYFTGSRPAAGDVTCYRH